MIEILHEYWKPLLWTDGYRFTGVAITLWLLILVGSDRRSHGAVSGDWSRLK
ncbi:histidine transport system permease HisM [Escherichia coli]|uniref:Histidine transport system permease HisM n=1 Tax=Escherichia coli TaxID=562 RepID=A0A447X195_ECOLX|nr:histidine transport system permease HisM [Escherichia coli]